jgi:hypothetical protein
VLPMKIESLQKVFVRERITATSGFRRSASVGDKVNRSSEISWPVTLSWTASRLSYFGRSLLDLESSRFWHQPVGT